jgi:hypothetical protein
MKALATQHHIDDKGLDWLAEEGRKDARRPASYGRPLPSAKMPAGVVPSAKALAVSEHNEGSNWPATSQEDLLQQDSYERRLAPAGVPADTNAAARPEKTSELYPKDTNVYGDERFTSFPPALVVRPVKLVDLTTDAGHTTIDIDTSELDWSRVRWTWDLTSSRRTVTDVRGYILAERPDDEPHSSAMALHALQFWERKTIEHVNETSMRTKHPSISTLLGISYVSLRGPLEGKIYQQPPQLASKLEVEDFPAFRKDLVVEEPPPEPIKLAERHIKRHVRLFVLYRRTSGPQSVGSVSDVSM